MVEKCYYEAPPNAGASSLRAAVFNFSRFVYRYRYVVFSLFVHSLCTIYLYAYTMCVFIFRLTVHVFTLLPRVAGSHAPVLCVRLLLQFAVLVFFL